MRAISAVLLVVLLASALQPGLMAAPLSTVAVPTPPIEQNITRRDQVDVHLYAARMSRNHLHELVAGGNVLQPDEWIQIGVVDPIGGEQLLQYIRDRTLANEWLPVVHPLNPNDIPAQSKFPIGTVHCPSVEVRNQLFGFLFHDPPILGLIHQPFRVLYQIGDPETSVDLSLAARAHADKIANILLERDDVDFARHINRHGFTNLVSYMAHRRRIVTPSPVSKEGTYKKTHKLALSHHFISSVASLLAISQTINSFAFLIPTIHPSIMAVPIPMRTISVALLLLLLLASALQPGLLAAPTASSVPVPMPPIEQDIDRRAGTIEVHIYGIRMLSSTETGYADTNTDDPKPDEWLRIRVGERSILYLGEDRGPQGRPKDRRGHASKFKHWYINPILQGTHRPPDQSTFLIGTVRCWSLEVLEEIFGSPIDNPRKRGLIHERLKADFGMQDPAEPGDLTWGALALVKRIEFIQQDYTQDGILVEFEQVRVGGQKTVLQTWYDECWEASKRSKTDSFE
ncbi:hypothetical protein EV360DRAFT_84227 [Lentinula raphanica]|nr:hypothetical protein EV360DRAFT_84227 [Lentinula raphanica]